MVSSHLPMVISQRCRLARLKLAPRRSVIIPWNPGSWRGESAPCMMARLTSAPFRLAPCQLESVRLAERRSTSIAVVWLQSAPVRSVFRKEARLRAGPLQHGLPHVGLLEVSPEEVGVPQDGGGHLGGSQGRAVQVGSGKVGRAQIGPRQFTRVRRARPRTRPAGRSHADPRRPGPDRTGAAARRSRHSPALASRHASSAAFPERTTAT